MAEKIVMVGQAPSASSDPSRPLARSTTRLAGFAGIDESLILDATERVNLIDAYPGPSNGGDAFPIKLARERAAALLPRLVGRRVILCGRAVAKAFEVDHADAFEWVSGPGFECAVIPHPSGVNRWWNDVANVERARAFLRETFSGDSRGHEPGGAWEFDASVARVFSDMLDRSIPQIDVMRDLVTDVADRALRKGDQVVDLGSSRGDAVAGLLARRGATLRYTLCEVSDPMLDALRERFAGEIAAGVVRVEDVDLRAPFRDRLPNARVVLCVLALQFTPIEHRLRILDDAASIVEPGGRLILVEKVIGATAAIDREMVELYYALKREHGYSQDEIDRKRLSLEGKLVPVTARWNEDLLRSVGFVQVDCFWRWCNFAAWVAVR